MIISRSEALEMDQTDPLAPIASHFEIPDGIIYLDGNSLGPPPMQAIERVRQAAESEWRQGLIRSWNAADWINLQNHCGDKIGRIIGAKSGEVIACDSVSVNIFKLAAALLMRNKIGSLAVQRDEFPTDGYILEGLSALTGATLNRLPADHSAPDSLEGISVLVKSAVHYKSAAIAEFSTWEESARSAGAAVIWDFSHATGLLDLNVKQHGMRYGVGCGYKYLNGGPGAPAYVYVDESEPSQLQQPLSGWMGHARPFDFAPGFVPAIGVKRFAAGTPPILSLSALHGALSIFENAAMSELEGKSRRLGDLFLSRCATFGLEAYQKIDSGNRGGHVSLEHKNGYEIVQALISKGVIGDFRAPNLMRFGFSPLFLSYVDVWDSAEILKDLLKSDYWRRSEFAVRGNVT